MWRFLQHPNILPLVGVTTLGTRFVMVSEWMKHGNINEFTKVHPDVDSLGLVGFPFGFFTFVKLESPIAGRCC